MRKGPNMTLADAQAHAKKHGYELSLQPHQREMVEDIIGKPLDKPRDRMNKTEAEFSRILEAQKQRGDDVFDWKFQPMRLAWGKDEKTGKQMWYKPDFAARCLIPSHLFGQQIPPRVRVIEVKGGHIWSRDLVRFRGCRAEWQWLFDFELWQKKAGSWRRLE